MDRGFLDGEEPVSLGWVCGHSGWFFSIFSFTIHADGDESARQGRHALPFFFSGFLQRFGHGFLEGRGFVYRQGAVNSGAAGGGDFLGEGLMTGMHVGGISDKGRGVAGLDTHTRGGGDGVLICAEE